VRTDGTVCTTVVRALVRVISVVVVRREVVMHPTLPTWSVETESRLPRPFWITTWAHVGDWPAQRLGKLSVEWKGDGVWGDLPSHICIAAGGLFWYIEFR
jgi:hypothetical protein